MKVSIITPTHNPKFLAELEQSIIAQTYTNWEWIILLNNGAKYEPMIRGGGGGEVKVIDCPFNNSNVGFLKKLACMQATGDVIIEADHDDILTPDCVEKVARAFADPEVGFVFSQNAKLSKDFRPYMAEYGWTHKFFSFRGKRIYAMNNQPVTAGRLGHIRFAPDHVRAWRKSVYDEIGGHDDTLSVCDDLDLMHRLYMATKFAEIEEVLYVYRITGDNTFVTRNKIITREDDRLYNQNIEGLGRRYAELNELDIIDLADSDGIIKAGGVISYMQQHRSDSVGLIVAENVLQYIPDTKAFMLEAHRVLAKGGLLISKTPSTDGRGAFADPVAKSYWNESSFWFYTREGYASKIKSKVMFRECRLETLKPTKFCEANNLAYVYADIEKL